MGTFEQELIDDLFEVLESIVGTRAVKVIKKRIENKHLTSPHEVAYEVATDLEELFGKKGAYATLREVGRHVAKVLMETHPREEWETLFQEGLKIMGYAKGVKREGNKACICSCIFYPKFLLREEIEPIDHPVCWMGLGFVEGFMKAFTGAHGVKFLKRDHDKEQCWFELVKF